MQEQTFTLGSNVLNNQSILCLQSFNFYSTLKHSNIGKQIYLQNKKFIPPAAVLGH